MPEETITLYASGSLPGIPGDHSPGTYLVDYEARTIRPAQESISNPISEPVEEQPQEEETMPEVVSVPDLPQEPTQATPEGNGVQVGG